MSTEDVDVLIERTDKETADDLAARLDEEGFWGPAMSLTSLSKTEYRQLKRENTSTQSTNATASSVSRASSVRPNTSSPSPRDIGTTKNTVVNDQLDTAQSAGMSASHQQCVKNVAAGILGVSDESNGDSSR